MLLSFFRMRFVLRGPFCLSCYVYLVIIFQFIFFSILCLFYIFIALLKFIHLSFSISLINLNDFTVNHFFHKVISLRLFTTFYHFQILMFKTCSCKCIKFCVNINRLYM